MKKIDKYICRIRSRRRGSFTVEASLIMSGVLGCFLIVLYGCLLLHDKTVLEISARQAARAANQYLTDARRTGSGEIDWEYFGKRPLAWRLNRSNRDVQQTLTARDTVEERLLFSKELIMSEAIQPDNSCVSYYAQVNPVSMFLWNNRYQWGNIEGTVNKKSIEQEEVLRLLYAAVS